MTHIAIQERLKGKAAYWMEKVSDEQYNAKGNGRALPRDLEDHDRVGIPKNGSIQIRRHGGQE